jgi:hypothetical protein
MMCTVHMDANGIVYISSLMINGLGIQVALL